MLILPATGVWLRRFPIDLMCIPWYHKIAKTRIQGGGDLQQTEAPSLQAVAVMRIIFDSEANIIEGAIIDIPILDNDNIL